MRLRPTRRALTVAGLLLVLAVMGGLTSYSVTLYRLFCQVTGAGGTTQRVAADSRVQAAKMVTVFFDTSVAPNLPWRFVPVQRQVRLHLGQDALVFFEAENLSDHPITGRATFNVTPEKSGLYFKKVQCFCFSEERLGPHQKVEMPVDFFVDPALATDPNTEEVDQITLSYTFFQALHPGNEAKDLARFAAAPPDPQAGAKLFAQDCASCHAADRAKMGPPLGGVVGRLAASAPGYAYSPALRGARLTWTPQTLDAWLAGPQRLVPGAAMPVSVPDEASRRDIIAYLKTLGAPAS